jgi:hypothetical protein
MKFIVLLIFCFLYGCSNISINSNADVYLKTKIENTLRKNEVDRHTNYEAWKLGGEQIGYVEVSYCQVDLRDFIPTTEDLISELEIKAHKLGGNSMVLDSCNVNKALASCHIYTQCRGMAYLVTYH